jgi:Flp pilus assembly protein TadG
MVHMTYVRSTPVVAQSLPNGHSGDQFTTVPRKGGLPTTRGVRVGPRVRMFAQAWRRRTNDESGAELVEFAFVVVLLVALLYGIISYGLILGAQAALNQAAADGARAGIVDPANAQADAQSQVGHDVGWMDKGPCNSSGTTITCNASEAACPSNPNNQCLTVTVIYNYASSPLFPELPGMGIVTPSTLTATNTLQISSPTSP